MCIQLWHIRTLIWSIVSRFWLRISILTFVFLLRLQLKTIRLKELADDIKSQRMQKNSNTKGQNGSNQKDFVGSDSRGSHVKELDEM